MSVFVCMNRGTGCNVAAGEGDTSGLRFRNMRKGRALCFASNNDNLALAGLVLAAAQVFTVFAAIAGLHIAAKISAIDLYITAQSTLGASQRYGFAHLVAENESAVVGNAKVAAHLKR